MLLVKSKELKNSNKKTPSVSVLAGVYALLLSFLPARVWAQESTQSISSPSSILSVFLSLLLVIAIILALAFVMRRFNVAQAGHGQMRVVASMMAGNKEKVMVIQVGDEQHLLGVTTHNINHLAKLETPLVDTSAVKGIAGQDSTQMNFQQKLVQAMANSISGNKNKDDRDGK